jgi:hypothetical protein
MTEVSQAERDFLASAERRLGRMILLLVPLGTAVAAWFYGGRGALAFAVGGALAYLNYRWIVAVVDTLVRAQKAEVPRRTYLKLFLPLILLVGVLYVIFSRLWLSVAGVLAGLSLLVVGVLVEALYQLLLGVRE